MVPTLPLASPHHIAPIKSSQAEAPIVIFTFLYTKTKAAKSIYLLWPTASCR